MTRSSLQNLQEGVQATQNTVRDLRAFQQQNETFKSQRPVECETALQEPISELLAGQQQINLKLTSIEARFMTNTESQSRVMMESIIKPWGWSNKTWTSESVRVTATVICANQASDCSCHCHRRSRPTKRTPKILERFIGTLFIGYLGIPYVNAPCDDSDCAQRSGSDIRLAYIFPAWVLARALILSLKLLPAYGPELNVRMPRIVSNSSRLFRCATDGDVDSMREILNQGLASPMDVDVLTGSTALMVSVFSL